MGWGGIIAGALGGGAEAIEDVSKKQIELDNKEHMAKFAADLELDKLRQADQMTRDTALWNTEGAGGDAKRKAEVKSAQGLAIGAADPEVLAANAKVAEKAAESARKAYDLATQGTVAREVAGAQARVQAETAEILKRGGDPAFVKAQHNIAMANHVESAGSLATAALARLQMSDVTQGQKLHADLAAARKSGDETAISVAQQAITDKAFSGKDTGAAYKAYQSASIAIINAEMKLNDPTKMLDPAAKLMIQGEIDDAKFIQRQSMKDLGAKVPDKAAATTPEAQGQADAQANVASGRVTLADANARLAKAGFRPITAAPVAPVAPEARVTALTESEQAAAANKKTWAEEKAKTEKSASDALRAEVSKLTVDQISELKPARATVLLNKYMKVLTSDQRAALLQQAQPARPIY
jgi:hypothetical protein